MKSSHLIENNSQSFIPSFMPPIMLSELNPYRHRVASTTPESLVNPQLHACTHSQINEERQTQSIISFHLPYNRITIICDRKISELQAFGNGNEP